jgi:hypothetical protein
LNPNVPWPRPRKFYSLPDPAAIQRYWDAIQPAPGQFVAAPLPSTFGLPDGIGGVFIAPEDPAAIPPVIPQPDKTQHPIAVVTPPPAIVEPPAAAVAASLVK